MFFTNYFSTSRVKVRGAHGDVQVFANRLLIKDSNTVLENRGGGANGDSGTRC